MKNKLKTDLRLLNEILQLIPADASASLKALVSEKVKKRKNFDFIKFTWVNKSDFPSFIIAEKHIPLSLNLNVGRIKEKLIDEFKFDKSVQLIFFFNGRQLPDESNLIENGVMYPDKVYFVIEPKARNGALLNADRFTIIGRKEWGKYKLWEDKYLNIFNLLNDNTSIYVVFCDHLKATLEEESLNNDNRIWKILLFLKTFATLIDEGTAEESVKVLIQILDCLRDSTDYERQYSIISVLQWLLFLHPQKHITGEGFLTTLLEIIKSHKSPICLRMEASWALGWAGVTNSELAKKTVPALLEIYRDEKCFPVQQTAWFSIIRSSILRLTYVNTISPLIIGGTKNTIETDIPLLGPEFWNMKEIRNIFLSTFSRYDTKIYDKHWISEELIKEVRKVKSFNYDRKIYDFIRDFESINEDIKDTVLRNIDNILQSYKQNNILKSLISLAEFENILKEDKHYKQHFIHQFQVFLTGCCIIDKNAEEFRSAYANAYSAYARLPLPWFLTSIFHDIGYSLQKFDNWIETYFKSILKVEDVPIRVDPLHLIFVDGIFKFLDRFIKFFWEMEKENIEAKRQKVHKIEKIFSTEEEFRLIFLNKFFNEKNHGVVSAISLLTQIEINENVEEENKKILRNEVYPAALAISMHDYHSWSQFEKVLLEKEDTQFEIHFEKQPLTFLLIYCDNVQEWGRPKSKEKDEEMIHGAVEPKLKRLSIRKGEVISVLKYNSYQKLREKKKELENLREILKSKNIVFKIILEIEGKSPYEFSTEIK